MTHGPADEPGRIRRLREHFERAAELPEGERVAYVERVAEPELRDALATMLANLDRTDVRLEAPLAEPFATPDMDVRVGGRLGPWTITRLIGHGGMGAVYEAARADGEFDKRVALKLVQAGPTSADTLTRFRRERQILAQLEHPHIATLLDGGVSPGGTPFLVMELVHGEPVTSWCDAKKLGVQERLLLFQQVCTAVQYAHGQLVVHRDLKPGNILVTPDGTVKLLDFGIARLLAAPDGEPALPVTRGESRAFTPDYASPEQIRGDALGTASDLFSLGVVLCELVTGARPWSRAGLSLATLERECVTTEPPKASALVTDAAALARGLADASALHRQLAGDLDAIVAKALRSEPAERFASVEALTDDLRRHEKGLPVLARRGGAGYRAGKFARRHAGAIAAALLVLGSLAGGIVGTRREAERARREQTRAERVSAFLAELMSSVRPSTGGRDVPVSELLEAASKRVSVELRDQPEARGELESVLGQSYLALGRYDDAERHFRNAFALARQVFGRNSREGAVALTNLAAVSQARGDPVQADSFCTAALAMHTAIRSPADTLLASMFSNMGSAAHDRGEMAVAERWHRQALALHRRLEGPGSDAVATATNNVAVALGEQGRWAAAESLHRDMLAILNANHRRPHRMIADAENAIATELDLQGKVEAADSMYRLCIEDRRQLLGNDHPDLAFTLFNYSAFLFQRGRHAEAARLAREVLSHRGRTIPDSHPAVAAALQTLGRAEDELGNHAGAEKALMESLELRRKSLPAGHWMLASSIGVLGEHYTKTGDLARAEPLLIQAEHGLEKQFGLESQRTQTNIERLVKFYSAAGRPAEAGAWRAKLTQPAEH